MASWISLLIAMVLGLVLPLGLSGCSTASVMVPFPASNASTAKGGQPQLAPHELGLLTIFAQKLIEHERYGTYDTLYESLTSPSFQASLSKTRFLKMTNCLQRHLGDYKGFAQDSIQHTGNNQLSYLIYRANNSVTVDVKVIRAGMIYKVAGIQWKTPNPGFQSCVKTALTSEQ